MNFKFALSLLSVGAIGAFANTINWTLDNAGLVENDPIKGHESSNWQYVFLTNDGGTLSDNGGSNNTYLETFDSSDGTNQGTWTDGLTTSTDYVVALWDGVTTGQYYAVKDRDNQYVTVNSDQFSTGFNATGPIQSGETALKTITDNLASGTYTAAAVPEPATAALAFVGVAMLIRRRK